MSEEIGFYTQIEGRFIIKMRDWIDEDFEDVELVLQKEINKALMFINANFEFNIAIDEINHILNCPYKAE